MDASSRVLEDAGRGPAYRNAVLDPSVAENPSRRGSPARYCRYAFEDTDLQQDSRESGKHPSHTRDYAHSPETVPSAGVATIPHEPRSPPIYAVPIEQGNCGNYVFLREIFGNPGKMRWVDMRSRFRAAGHSLGSRSMSSRCRSWMISALVGRDSMAPNFVQTRAPAAEANLTASRRSCLTPQ